MKKRIFGIIISFLGLFISIILLFLSINYNKKTLLITYNVVNNIDYKVYLIKNDFYDKEYITNEKNIPINFIDYINVDFGNKISFSNITNLTYSYDVVARIEVTDVNKQTNNVVFTKDYELLNDSDIYIRDISSNTINKSVSIDYNKYNDIVNKYKLKLQMPVNATLKIIINISNKTNLINNDDKLVLTIPLSVNTIDITKDYNNYYSKDIYNSLRNGTIYIVLSSILLILSIVILTLTFKNFFLNDDNYMKYKLNKILKYYEQIIVVVSNPPKIEKNSILKINYFKDMIDLNRELKQPILYYKSENSKYGIFMIIDFDKTYIYTISNEKEKI